MISQSSFGQPKKATGYCRTIGAVRQTVAGGKLSMELQFHENSD
jgi:hypothetical protein